MDKAHFDRMNREYYVMDKAHFDNVNNGNFKKQQSLVVVFYSQLNLALPIGRWGTQQKARLGQANFFFFTFLWRESMGQTQRE